MLFFFSMQGIPLGAAVAYTLADRHNLDVGFSYDRKEAKDHGEKGKFVGEDLKVKLILRWFVLCSLGSLHCISSVSCCW